MSQLRDATSCYRFTIIGVACSCLAMIGCAPDTGPEFKLLHEYKGFDSRVVHAQFNSDSSLIAAGGSRGIIVWDAKTGNLQTEFGESCFSLQFLPNTTELLVAVANNELAISSANDGRRIRLVTSSLKCPQYAMAVSAEGHYALTGDGYEPGQKGFVAGENSARLWNLRQSTLIREFHGHRGAIYAVAFSPDGKLALSAGCDGTMRLWNIDTGAELQQYGDLHIPERFDRIPHGSVCFSPDGKLGLKGWQLWDLEKREMLHRLRVEEQDPKIPQNIIVKSYAIVSEFTLDGKRIVSGDNDGRIRLWETSTGKLLCEARAFKNRSEVWSIALSPDGKTVLTAGDGHIPGFSAVASGEPGYDLTVRLFKLPE